MAGSSSRAETRPECQYGLLCRRKNEEHWRDFSHPSSESKNGNCRKVLLMLVGLPGSGKSTFCERLVESNPSTWRRICQDTISNGKRGTKEQCLKAAEKSLQEGINVMIDRCNLTKEQRVEFLKLAKRAQVQAHALVLDLPVKTCIQRALQRTGHEGGLEGNSAPVAVQRMAKHKELPLELEGFSSILACSKDDDVEEAVSMYSKFYLRNQVDISKSKDIGVLQKEADTNKVSGNHIDEGARTLAFPSISTSDFQFDHEKAAEIIVKTAAEFLQKPDNSHFRLIFVDLKEDSDMLLRVRRKAGVYGLGSENFMAVAGDITKLRSSCGLQCSFIANAANWRLKPGGGGVNAAIYRAAGEGLEIETKKRAKTLNPGSALVVPLPLTSPICINEGVTYIIHALGPNMNPQRPNCLHGDYITGSKLLMEAYSCMFHAFASQVQSLSSNEPNSKKSDLSSQEAPRDAFSVLMQSTKRKSRAADSYEKVNLCRENSLKEGAKGGLTNALPEGTVNNFGFREKDDAKSKKPLLSQSETVTHADEAQRPLSNSENAKIKQWEPWSEALRKIILYPEHHKDLILHAADEAVVISDKFPKSKRHFLVVSRLDGLDSIKELNRSHLSLLRCMDRLGMTCINSSLQQDKSLMFRMGYHSEPSMRQLHMHVISQDFDSPALKNKKHWNSFTTSFFCDSQQVIKEIEETGRVTPGCDEKSLMKMELRCHRCRSAQPNIPRLKQHISLCQAPFLADLVEKGFLVTAEKGESHQHCDHS